MKLCVYGAGAIGGTLAVELSLAGVDVSCVARGPHLKAIQASGLKLVQDGKEKIARVRAVEDARELGPQDYVIIALKAHGAAAAAARMVPLLGPNTSVVTAQNGIPWWYFHRHGGAHAGRRLEAVDPGGTQWSLIGPERAIGCVVYPAAEVEAPGVVHWLYGNRFMLGEPDGSKSPRLEALSKALTAAGFKAPVRPRIRDDIWLKLWGNLSFNPVSVLTHATLVALATEPDPKSVIRAMMVEAQQVGEALGASFSVDVETRIGWAGDVGAHKTSMLQDLERGRPMEIEALLGVVVEMARLAGVATPTLDMILALVRTRARVAAQSN
ncbi:MAG: 2-dehydropantoate 2-reductase [Alphaproteobacteria bacterium]|nr:2-dehydropantoate 2-reductase [Alphaproteobacteria bacterium]